MMTEVKVIDFTRYPGPRFKKLGKGSGEEFRESYLYPKFSNDHELVVNLDGAKGYGSSFLEEAFGGLIRKYNLTKNDVKFLMDHIISKNDPTLADEVREYMQDALNVRTRK